MAAAQPLFPTGTRDEHWPAPRRTSSLTGAIRREKCLPRKDASLEYAMAAARGRYVLMGFHGWPLGALGPWGARDLVPRHPPAQEDDRS